MSFFIAFFVVINLVSMWYKAGKFILQQRLVLLTVLFAATLFMGWKASHVQLGYDFTKALPTDNPKYVEYQAFLKKFGADGNTMVIGIESDKFYTTSFFNELGQLHQHLKSINGVTEILSIPEVVNLVNDSANHKLLPVKIFNYPFSSQASLDSARLIFKNLPFYRKLLYNPQLHTYLMGVSVNKDTINSKSRTRLINDILQQISVFEIKANTKVHTSGLPFIRTTIGNRIKNEMNWFLIGSLVLSAITLFIFFRSFSATLMSLLVVGMGVVWCLGTIVLFGYKITLLTALIPPLVVVIGIPNCIYFLNKYHTAYREVNNKEEALITMVGRMGIVTLFCNIAAAIGFAVFALTHSDLLKEFGAVAGINIMALFLISLIFIPTVLSYLPPPKSKHTRYLDNAFLEKILVKIEQWAFYHAKWVYGITVVITVFAVMGIFRIKSEGFIVDDLPKKGGRDGYLVVGRTDDGHRDHVPVDLSSHREEYLTPPTSALARSASSPSVPCAPGSSRNGSRGFSKAASGPGVAVGVVGASSSGSSGGGVVGMRPACSARRARSASGSAMCSR